MFARKARTAMSVLNDIVPENGLWVRALAKQTSTTEARLLMEALKKFVPIRMDKSEYLFQEDDLPVGMLDVCAPYWSEEKGIVGYALPGGTFEDFIKRMLKNERLWGERGYQVSTRRLQKTKELAADLNLANYMFPFKTGKNRSNPIVTHCIVPFMQRWRGDVYQGTGAIYKMISLMDNDTVFRNQVTALSNKKPGEKGKFLTDFATFATLFAVGTSLNSGDAGVAVMKLTEVDEKLVNKAISYSGLADIANIATYVMRASRRNGQIGKRFRKQLKKVSILDRMMKDSESKDEEALEMLDRFHRGVYKEMCGKKSAVRLSYRTTRSPRIRISAVNGFALVVFPDINAAFVFSNEDLKNLKFAAMSHSMWNWHAGTIDQEYTEPVMPAFFREQKEAALDLSVLGQIFEGKDAAHDYFEEKWNVYHNQEVVPKERTKMFTLKLWKLYIETITTHNEIRTVDHLGRMWHEMFEVYTTHFAGRLAEQQLKVQKIELFDKYGDMGFPIKSYYRRFERILDCLPFSVAQDLGRIAKIVPCFNINTAAAFLERCEAMDNPNPIGTATYIGNNEFHLNERLIDPYAEARFKCAMKLLIASGEFRKCAYAVLDDDTSEALENEPFSAILSYLKEHSIPFRTNIRMLDAMDCQVPLNHMAGAIDAARDFIQTGILPIEVFAGAFIDISGVYSYKERGDPDLANLKSSALPPEDINIALGLHDDLDRMTVTRDQKGVRSNAPTSMIESYLMNQYPSRGKAVRKNKMQPAHYSASCKMETNKAPGKTRIIISGCARARRIQSEFEYNNGVNMRHIPGFTMGMSPIELQKRFYLAIAEKLNPDLVNLSVSLDLSSFSTGMHVEPQVWCNQVLAVAYDRPEINDIMDLTIGSIMYVNTRGWLMAKRNWRGANYEGIDGKRNTLIHCTLWYMARARAATRGLVGNFRAFLFIDDGNGMIEVPKDELDACADILWEALMHTYYMYGFKLSNLKTLMSDIYAQFLNELYIHGMHVAYGFRALCHVGAQSFPPVATLLEEIAVITGGIRGSALAGGHPMRMFLGYVFLIVLYWCGVIGNYASTLGKVSGRVLATAMYIPVRAGGFGMANFTELFSNLAGHKVCESLDRVRRMARVSRTFNLPEAIPICTWMRANLSNPVPINNNENITHLSAKYKPLNYLQAGDRDEKIAKNAIKICRNRAAKTLILNYLNLDKSRDQNSFSAVFIDTVERNNILLPTVIAEKAIANDPDYVMKELVKKISSSYYVEHFLSREDQILIKRRYRHHVVTYLQRLTDHLMV